jgi:GPI mannosyltransferase 3
MSTTPTALWQSFDDHSRALADSIQRLKRNTMLPPRPAATAQQVFLGLIAFRILNALCVQTFFQPDEFFQSLEPAWQVVFGEKSGAWITWVRESFVA